MGNTLLNQPEGTQGERARGPMACMMGLLGLALVIQIGLLSALVHSNNAQTDALAPPNTLGDDPVAFCLAGGELDVDAPTPFAPMVTSLLGKGCTLGGSMSTINLQDFQITAVQPMICPKRQADSEGLCID